MKFNETQYYYQGYSSHSEGLSYDGSPHEVNTGARFEWCRGWRDAEYDSRRRLQKYEAENTNQQFESLAAKPVTVWNGEGLPPVGCECEWQDKNTQQWVKVSIVYASEWVTVIREDKIAEPVEIAIENYGDEARKTFRPVRSEQEVKREEVIDGIVRFFIGYHAYPKGAEEYLKVAKALYCVIAAGKILHIKLETADE